MMSQARQRQGAKARCAHLGNDLPPGPGRMPGLYSYGYAGPQVARSQGRAWEYGADWRSIIRCW